MSATVTRLPDLSPSDFTEQHPHSKPLEPWVVIVHNCDCHTIEGVVWTLMKALDFNQRTAEAHALAIHRSGRSVVKMAHKEAAEHYADLIRTESRGRTLAGRMDEELFVTIEPR